MLRGIALRARRQTTATKLLGGVLGHPHEEDEVDEADAERADDAHDGDDDDDDHDGVGGGLDRVGVVLKDARARRGIAEEAASTRANRL